MLGKVGMPDMKSFDKPSMERFLAMEQDNREDHAQAVAASLSLQLKDFDSWRRLRPHVKRCINQYLSMHARADDPDVNDGKRVCW